MESERKVGSKVGDALCSLGNLEGNSDGEVEGLGSSVGTIELLGASTAIVGAPVGAAVGVAVADHTGAAVRCTGAGVAGRLGSPVSEAGVVAATDAAAVVTPSAAAVAVGVSAATVVAPAAAVGALVATVVALAVAAVALDGTVVASTAAVVALAATVVTAFPSIVLAICSPLSGTRDHHLVKVAHAIQFARATERVAAWLA